MTSSFKIKDVIKSQRDLVLEEMNQQLGRLPRSPYQDFLLKTDIGQSRLATWVELVINAIDGEFTVFRKDMEKAGYERAIQGFQLGNVSDAYQIFLETCLNITQKTLSSRKLSSWELIEQIKTFVKVCFKGYASVAGSFLITREEIINEKVLFLQNLLNFTRQMITTVDAESIINLTSEDISKLFGTGVFISVRRNGRLIHFQNSKPIKPIVQIAKMIEKSWGKATSFFSDLDQNVSTNVDAFDLKGMIAIPIGAHGRVHGVLTLISDQKGIQFGHKELDMLLQFNYIVAMAMEKSFMVEEIEENREELSRLSSKVITLGEEQRKLLAADIHDTMAQALAGIGYKIQFCSEMLGTRTDLVEKELNELHIAVDNAIRQTRELMSSLHPILIETSGLIPALRNLINTFTGRTNIKVSKNLPEELDLHTKLSICIYRVVEEAIRNVEKHAGADAIQISIWRRDNEIIIEISDNGKGFDISVDRPWVKDSSKFGLLYMRQRVEAVGGEFSINAVLGKGCTISAKAPMLSIRRINE